MSCTHTLVSVIMLELENIDIIVVYILLYLLQQCKPRRSLKMHRRRMEVVSMYDSSSLNRGLPIIFPMVAHLADNPCCNWWKEPGQHTH